MANASSGRYWVAFSDPATGGDFFDLTSIDGVAILKVDGFLDLGEAINVYTAQWTNEQKEDMLITTKNDYDDPIIIRKNPDIDITFIIRQKYASETIDVLETHDILIFYLTTFEVWIKDTYVGDKYVHCVCLKGYKPTTVKLGRGDNSYIMGTVTLHCLDRPDETTNANNRMAKSTPSFAKLFRKATK